MKSIICAALLSLAGSAFAQEIDVRPVLGMGVTFGGDNLATVQYTNGDTATLHAGGLVHLYGGVDIGFTPQVSAQLNVGYHVDNTTGSNGSLKFDRVPVELLGHYKLNDAFRLGLGARFVSSAKLSGSGVLNGIDGKFDSTTGTVLEGEYFFTRGWAVKGRYVSEKYKISGTNEKVDGSHGGIYIAYYFN